MKKSLLLLAASTTLFLSVEGRAAPILEVDFNDGLVPADAFVIDDSGGGVNVVAGAGNLTDTPLLLSGTSSQFAGVAFLFPQVADGRWHFAWDSLVLSRQPEDRDIYGRDQTFVVLLAQDAELRSHVPWSLEYDASGQMLLGCCNSSIPVSLTMVGSYDPDQSDHFDLYVDLDSDTYRLNVNGQPRAAGLRLLYPAVRGIAFSSPGRFFLQDPAALAVDNVRVVLVPTLPGDTNADGLVNIDDLNNVRNFFGTGDGTDLSGIPGDAYPFDGLVNIDDLNAVRNDFGAASAAVPEPAPLVLIVLACVLFPTELSLRNNNSRRRHWPDAERA